LGSGLSLRHSFAHETTGAARLVSTPSLDTGLGSGLAWLMALSVPRI
jgi:hypothetical protein